MDAIFWYGPGLNFLRHPSPVRNNQFYCTILSSDKGLFFHYVSQIFQFLEPFPLPPAPPSVTPHYSMSKQQIYGPNFISKTGHVTWSVLLLIIVGKICEIHKYFKLHGMRNVLIFRFMY